MVPTNQTQTHWEEGHRPKSHSTLLERSGMLCAVKYCNSLPDIPFDPKLMPYAFDQHWLVQYKATFLERQCKYDLPPETDLGVTILDLLKPGTSQMHANVLLDAADEELQEEEEEEEEMQAATSCKRSQLHAKVIPWMRKTEYVCREFKGHGICKEKPEVKIGVSLKQQQQQLGQEEMCKDQKSQIRAIEKTFQDAQKCICEHRSKCGVIPVQVMPVFPDFKMWINPWAQVTFDCEPVPKDPRGPAALEMMSQAMIRGRMDEQGKEFVACFVPVEETLRKRKRDQEEEMDHAPDDVYDYRMAGEYNWHVKNKASQGWQGNYFFIMREGDGVYYNELEARVHLSKRPRANTGQQSATNALLGIKHRPMNQMELQAQEARKAQLQNHEPPDQQEKPMDMQREAPAQMNNEKMEAALKRRPVSKKKSSGQPGTGIAQY